jgi:hypothetical protein
MKRLVLNLSFTIFTASYTLCLSLKAHLPGYDSLNLSPLVYLPIDFMAYSYLFILAAAPSPTSTDI